MSYVPSVHFPEYNQIVKSVMRADALLNGQKRVLELLVKRAPLVEVLHHLVSILEEQYDGLLCSILLVDEQTQTFKAGVDIKDSKNYSLEASGVSILPPYVGPCIRRLGSDAFGTSFHESYQQRHQIWWGGYRGSDLS